VSECLLSQQTVIQVGVIMCQIITTKDFLSYHTISYITVRALYDDDLYNGSTYSVRLQLNVLYSSSHVRTLIDTLMYVL
jgi:hypothetical protein